MTSEGQQTQMASESQPKMASPQEETSQKPASIPAVPATSSDGAPTSNGDDGTSRRPRDARLIHLILSAQGVHSYQERVPLQLLDFAYRYTSSVLSDALRMSAEGYSAAPGASTSKRDLNDGSNMTVNALRQAIASRQDYQFQGALPKEFMLEQAAERNRVVLPKIDKSWGVQLPPEKYCLTGTGWSLRDQWDSDEDDDEGAVRDVKPQNGHSFDTNGDVGMDLGGLDGDATEEKDAMDSFEDVFGGGGGGGGGGGNNDEDHEMAEA